MLPLGMVFVIALFWPAQNLPEPAYPYQIGDPRLSAGTMLSGDFENRQVLKNFGLQKRVSHHPYRLSTPGPWNNPHVCYAIRSYIFRREDSRAPVLVKTTTCTHVLVGMEEVSRPPKARLIPAD